MSKIQLKDFSKAVFGLFLRPIVAILAIMAETKIEGKGKGKEKFAEVDQNLTLLESIFDKTNVDDLKGVARTMLINAIVSETINSDK